MTPERLERLVTPTVARHTLYHFREGGYAPGSFVQSLLETIGRADPFNTAILSSGYPRYVAAMRLAREVDGGIDTLKRIASRSHE